jgi:Mrp family chromosome partitioning ATPase
MGVLDYVRVLGRRWRWVLVSALAVLVASVLWAVNSPASWSSTETLFYTGAAQDAATDTRLNSYASLATSARLVDAIRAELGLTESTAQVGDRISAKAEPNTLIVTVTAKESTADGARRLAAAAARQLVLLSTSLETTTGGGLPLPSTGGATPSAGTPQPTASAPAAGPSSTDPIPGRLVAADSATTAVEENTSIRIIGLGLVFGLLTGVVLALLREATDSRVRSPEQLHHLGIPEQRVVRVEDSVEDLPLGQVAEGYRVLRTVLFRGGHTQPTSLVVSSADPDHVSPGVAGALATTFARAATRVVLVSTNLRPSRSGSGWATGEPGLGNVLAGQNPLADAVEPAQQDDLWLMPGGRSLPYPEDVLASIAMSEIVGELRAEFDLVIMDALPLAACADALSVAEATGAGVLLTIAEGRTRRQQVRAALDTLASLGVPVVAVALVRPAQKTVLRGPAHARPGAAAPAARQPPSPVADPATGVAGTPPTAGAPAGDTTVRTSDRTAPEQVPEKTYPAADEQVTEDERPTTRAEDDAQHQGRAEDQPQPGEDGSGRAVPDESPRAGPLDAAEQRDRIEPSRAPL